MCISEMCISELTVSEQWKGKLNGRKFYRRKIFFYISVMHYFYCIAEIKRLIVSTFRANNRLISYSFLTLH